MPRANIIGLCRWAGWRVSLRWREMKDASLVVFFFFTFFFFGRPRRRAVGGSARLKLERPYRSQTASRGAPVF